MECNSSAEACSEDKRLFKTPAEVIGLTRSRRRHFQRLMDHRAIERPASERHQHHPSPTFVAAGQTVLVEGLAHWTSSVVAAPRAAF